jgi:hypothetical protein
MNLDAWWSGPEPLSPSRLGGSEPAAPDLDARMQSSHDSASFHAGLI